MTKLENMRVSDRLVEHVKAAEGYRSTAYKPVAAERYFTIGYGHYGPDVARNQAVTRARAERILRMDLRTAEQIVKREVTLPRLRQGRYDALVDLAYNIGAGNFASSTLLRHVNRAEHRRAVLQFARWAVGANRQRLPGLVKRRAAEARMYSSTRWPKR